MPALAFLVMPPCPLFLVTDSFVVRRRGTVLIGPPESEVRKMLAVGAELVLQFPDGRSVRTTIRGLGSFMMDPPSADSPVGVLLADDLGKVPEGTAVYAVDPRA